MASAAYSKALPMILSASFMMCAGGCAAVGSLMSPYSEKFSCKNDDHGQCIHPDRAYADAVAGVPSRSDPAVSNTRRVSRRKELRLQPHSRRTGRADAFSSYKDSVYRELKSLIETPAAPMLQPARTVRTLILPYADKQRPDRLYMPRYVYSVLDKPAWIIGDVLVETPGRSIAAPVLGQVSGRAGRENASGSSDFPSPALLPSAPQGNRP